MAQRIEINTPEFRVPRIETPLIDNSAAGVLNQAAKSADYLGKVWDERQEKIGKTNAALNLARLRNDITARIADDNANGRIADGYTQSVIDDVISAGEAMRKSDNRHEADAATVGLLELESWARTQATAYEVSAGETRRFAVLDAAVEQYKGVVASDPSQFATVHAKVDELIDGYAGPAERLPALKRLREEFGESYLHAVMAADPAKAQSMIRSGEASTLGIDNDRLPVLRELADDKVRQQLHLTQLNQNHARATHYRAAVETTATVLARVERTGAPPTPDEAARISSGLSPRQVESFKAELAESKAVFAVTGNLPSQSMSQIDKLVAANRRAGEGADAQRSARVAALVNEERRMRKENPVSAARRGFANVDNAWNAFAADQSPEKLRSAIAETMSAQDVMEIPRTAQRVMPQEMAHDLAARLNREKSEGAYEAFASLKARFGDKYWDKAYSQIRKDLPFGMRVAGTMKNQHAAELLVEVSRQPRETLLKITDPGDGDNSLFARIARDRRVERFVASLVQRPSGYAHSGDVVDSIETLARGYMTKNATNQAAAVEFAIHNIVGDNYDSVQPDSGPPMRLPKKLGLDPLDVARGAYLMRRNVVLTAADVEKPDDGSSHADAIKAVTAGVRERSYWVTNDNETGAILFEGGRPVTTGGKIVQYRFEDLAKVQPGFREMPAYVAAKVGNSTMTPPVVPKLWNGEEEDDAEESRREMLKGPAPAKNAPARSTAPAAAAGPKPRARTGTAAIE